jgi:tetratricopeptide (TPR) repeat protein
MNNRDQLLDEIRELALHAVGEDRDVAAIELLNAYLKHRTTDGFIWFRFGDLLRTIGLKDEAERALYLALETAPSERHGQICLSIARLHDGAGRHAQAEEFYRQTCEDPIYAQRGFAWILRGANLAIENELKKAEECHRHALTFFDEHVDRDEAYLNLGYVLRAQGRYAEAAKAFRNALEIAPHDKEALEAMQTLCGIDIAIAKVNELKNTVD